MTNHAKHTNRFWGERPLPKSKAEFFNAITTPAPVGDGAIATIRMYGPIDSWGGYWGVSAKDVSAVLDALPDSVDQIILRINSPGGEVFEGMAILNTFRAHKASVMAVVDGLAASTASFIAAGCDETVMSPGTQMLIHSPWTFTLGSAADLRKEADALDKCSASIVEIYSAKAGEKDWPALMADDNWLTTADTIELGLADRVAVIPDAGETDTVGVEEEVIALPDEDDPMDSAARVIRIVARARTSPHHASVSTEPAATQRKEVPVTDSALTAGLRTRLGVTEADPSDETLLAALDEALAEQPSNSTTAVLPGTTLIDSQVLADLQANAAAGMQARQEQVRAERVRIVDTALNEGRITPTSRDGWLSLLEKDQAGAAATLALLPENSSIPTKELGRSEQADVVADDAYPSNWKR